MILLEQLLDMLSLFLLFKLEDFLTELDQFRLFRVLHDDLQLLLRVLLESISIEERVARLTSDVM